MQPDYKYTDSEARTSVLYLGLLTWLALRIHSVPSERSTLAYTGWPSYVDSCTSFSVLVIQSPASCNPCLSKLNRGVLREHLEILTRAYEANEGHGASCITALCAPRDSRSVKAVPRTRSSVQREIGRSRTSRAGWTPSDLC